MFNRQQQTLMLTLLNKLSMVATFYFLFFPFIIGVTIQKKTLIIALMSNAVSLVCGILSLIAWATLETWIRHPEMIPTFKFERTPKTAKEKKKKTKKKNDRLPIF